MMESGMNDVPLDGGGGGLGGTPAAPAPAAAPPAPPSEAPPPPPAEEAPSPASSEPPNSADTTDGGSSPTVENGDDAPAPAPPVPVPAPAAALPAVPAPAPASAAASKAELFGSPAPAPASANDRALLDDTREEDDDEAEADLFGALPPSGASRLASSGLLGSLAGGPGPGGGGGGGLFDDVDREAEERAKREAEEKARREAEEKARREAEERERKAREERERKAREEEERRRAVAAQEAAMAQAQAQQQAAQQQAQAQQQQQGMGAQGLQQGVAGMTLGGGQALQPGYGQNGMAAQPGAPPGQVQPQANGSTPGAAPVPAAAGGGGGGRPLSFAERSAQMQQQAQQVAQQQQQQQQREAQARMQQMQAQQQQQQMQQAQMQGQYGGQQPGIQQQQMQQAQMQGQYGGQQPGIQQQPQQPQGYLGQMAGQQPGMQQPGMQPQPQAGMQASYMYSTAGGPQQQTQTTQTSQQQQPQPQLGARQAQTLPGTMVGQQAQQQYQQGAGGMHGRYYGTTQQPAVPPPQQQQQPQPGGYPGQQLGQQQMGMGVGMGMGGHQVPFPHATPQAARQQQQQHQVYAQTKRDPSLLAGLHCGTDPNLGGVAQPRGGGGQAGQPGAPGQPGAAGGQPPQILGHVLPASSSFLPSGPFEPLYGKITVSDPLLVQGHGLFAGPPHWTYAVTVRVPGDTQPRGGVTVRRRFRHFVSLEERLREGCPGAVLPPRPEKHPTRAIEEASTRQSAQFAMQRSSELEEYLNALVKHPIAGGTDVLRLFLTLQDDIGTAWPEVSSSALTRLGAVSAVTASKVAEGTATAIQELQQDQKDAGEDDAELLALAASEGLRIGSVVQAVPKIEGALSLVRDQGERSGVVGLEMSKLAKDVQGEDGDLSASLDLLSSALLRSGRRTKRLAVELSAAAAPFVSQYKLCRYERMAFADRRAALARRTTARSRADSRAQKLVMHQSNMSSLGRPGYVERMEMEASLSDESAVAALREADVVGMTLRREVARVALVRKTEWSASLKVLASSMKEACTERAAIWESAREQFKSEFPDFAAAAQPGAGVPAPTPVN